MADRIIMATPTRTRSGSQTKPYAPGALRRFCTAMLLSKEIWIVYASGFLCGRASLGSGIYPFGLALFWTVVRSGRRTHAIGGFFAILLGMATVAPVYRLLAIAVVLLGGLFVHTQETELQRSRGTFVWRQGLLMAGGHLMMRLLFARLFEVGWESGLWIAIEALLVVSTIVLWRPLSDLWEGEFQQRITREGWASIALFAVMLSLGLGAMAWGPLVPVEIWNRLITLVAALIGGAATGAAVGTALGWITGVSGVSPLGGATIYAVAGLLAGLLGGRGKLFVALGFLMGHLILSLQTPNPSEIVLSLMHALVALAFLSLIPGGWLRSLERTLPGSRARERFMRVREDRLREAVSERLTKVSGLLAEMGRTFSVAKNSLATAAEDATDVDEVVEEITLRLCQKCPGYRKCWEEHLYQTYKELVEFITVGESKGVLRETSLPTPLRQRCFRTSQLTQTAHGILAELHERSRWQKRLAGQSNVIPVQLHGIAALIEGLAEQVRIETGRSDELQVMLADALREVRSSVSHVRVRALGMSQRFEIMVERSSPCDRIGLWREQVQQVVAQSLDGEYAIWKEECTQEGPCKLWLAEKPAYIVEQARISVAKEPSGVSGDTVTTVDLVDGRVAMILSDGMGTGPQAAIQSQSAVQLLGTLLETGFDLRSSVRSVNSLLLMRTSDESFATIDAVVIDRFTGLAEFLKVGSAPTFIKRGSEVDVIRSASMPVGIVKHIEVRVQQRQLQPGDMVILTTDGFLDSIGRDVDQEEWIARVLRREESTAPQALLDATLQRCLDATGGVWCDDVTLVAMHFLECPPLDESSGAIPEYRRVSGEGQ